MQYHMALNHLLSQYSKRCGVHLEQQMFWTELYRQIWVDYMYCILRPCAKKQSFASQENTTHYMFVCFIWACSKATTAIQFPWVNKLKIEYKITAKCKELHWIGAEILHLIQLCLYSCGDCHWTLMRPPPSVCLFALLSSTNSTKNTIMVGVVTSKGDALGTTRTVKTLI